ncbi:MAG: hypothetical protein U9Q69_00855 [Nanoarchaeota archaeon]|nr:hypothetical protein [Nanoarchaeota archaeon]
MGLIDSTIIKDNKMEVGNITLEFDAEIYNELVNHYKINEGKEIKVCLLGEQNETHILINDLFYPKISSQSYNHVTSKICPKKTIISLHSQPNRQCLPSDQDIESLKYLKQYNENVLVAIMCEEKRFNFYS